MKSFPRALLAVLSTACLATFATAQTIPVGTFKHIIIIVQENRTPDNLFGARATGGPCTITNPFTGADINNGGFYLNTISEPRSATFRRP
jgi:phospholipase C